jgi:hypothetical protein
LDASATRARTLDPKMKRNQVSAVGPSTSSHRVGRELPLRVELTRSPRRRGMAAICAQRPLIIVRQWRLSRRSAALARPVRRWTSRAYPDPSRESPRGRRECFRQADGKPELMIDRAHGGALSGTTIVRVVTGGVNSCAGSEPASMLGSVRLDLIPQQHPGAHRRARSRRACRPSLRSSSRLGFLHPL